MGQAKQRGTFEQRRKSAIDRKNKETEDAKKACADWWNSLSDEAKELELERRRKRAKAAQIISLWTGNLIDF